MFGDTRFYANFSFIGSMPEKDIYCSIIRDAIDKNIKEIKEHCFCFNDKDETIINDWFNQIYIDAGYHPSITYDYLPVYFEIASQLVEHGLCKQVKIDFEWMGDKAGDYTKNSYTICKQDGKIVFLMDRVQKTITQEQVHPSLLVRRYC